MKVEPQSIRYPDGRLRYISLICDKCKNALFYEEAHQIKEVKYTDQTSKECSSSNSNTTKKLYDLCNNCYNKYTKFVEEEFFNGK